MDSLSSQKHNSIIIISLVRKWLSWNLTSPDEEDVMYISPPENMILESQATTEEW